MRFLKVFLERVPLLWDSGTASWDDRSGGQACKHKHMYHPPCLMSAKSVSQGICATQTGSDTHATSTLPFAGLAMGWAVKGELPTCRGTNNSCGGREGSLSIRRWQTVRLEGGPCLLAFHAAKKVGTVNIQRSSRLFEGFEKRP